MLKLQSLSNGSLSDTAECVVHCHLGKPQGACYEEGWVQLAVWLEVCNDRVCADIVRVHVMPVEV